MVGGEVFFFKLYLVWRVKSGQWTFHASFIWERAGGFIFLSANGKAQGALLLFLLSLGDGKDFFFHFSLFPNMFSQCSLLVPNGFLICSPSSQCVSQHVLHISTSLLIRTDNTWSAW